MRAPVAGRTQFRVEQLPRLFARVTERLHVFHLLQNLVEIVAGRILQCDFRMATCPAYWTWVQYCQQRN
jgi:hypothetical protein